MLCAGCCTSGPTRELTFHCIMGVQCTPCILCIYMVHHTFYITCTTCTHIKLMYAYCIINKYMHIYIYIYIYTVSCIIYMYVMLCVVHMWPHIHTCIYMYVMCVTTVNIFMQSYSHSLLTCTMVLSEVATFYRWYILQHI